MKMKTIEERQSAIIRVLEDIKQSDPRANMLAEQLATSLYMRDLLLAETMTPDFKLTREELSSEGEPREKFSKLPQEIARWHEQVRKDLDALLLTLKGKAKFAPDSDNSIEDFYKQFMADD